MHQKLREGMRKCIRNKAASRLWTRGDPSGIRADRTRKVTIILDALDAAAAPDDVTLPGFRFHPPKGDRAGGFAVSVSRCAVTPAAAIGPAARLTPVG